MIFTILRIFLVATYIIFPRSGFAQSSADSIDVEGVMWPKFEGLYLRTKSGKLFRLFKFETGIYTDDPYLIKDDKLDFKLVSRLPFLPAMEIESLVNYGVDLTNYNKFGARLEMLAFTRQYCTDAAKADSVASTCTGDLSSFDENTLSISSWGVDLAKNTLVERGPSGRQAYYPDPDRIGRSMFLMSKSGTHSGQKPDNIPISAFYVRPPTGVVKYGFLTDLTISGALWNMHENDHYVDDWEYFVDLLLNTEGVHHSAIGTAAWVYRDHDRCQKAIDLYEERVLPEANKSKNAETITFFAEYFEKLKNCKK